MTNWQTIFLMHKESFWQRSRNELENKKNLAADLIDHQKLVTSDFYDALRSTKWKFLNFDFFLHQIRTENNVLRT